MEKAAALSLVPEGSINPSLIKSSIVIVSRRYTWQSDRADIPECPETVLVLPVGQKNIVILIEEYDLDAGVWQLTLPDGNVIDTSPDRIWHQAQNELREETGFRAGRFEKLLDCYNHPGYMTHKVQMLDTYDLE